MTPIQRELIIGSLLGDGHLSLVSKRSARFSESHCLKQEHYLDWKIGILGDLVSSVYPVRKVVGDREFFGKGFSTISSSGFLSLYDLFYKDGHRVFPESLSELMTPFVLAVWFMDDGSLTTRKDPRISFGLDEVSLERADKALRKLGLTPKCYGSGSNRVIMFPKQKMEFRKLVAPYLVLGYKLPVESLNQERFRRANAVSREQILELLDRGLSVSEVSKKLRVSVTTIRRRIRHAL